MAILYATQLLLRVFCAVVWLALLLGTVQVFYFSSMLVDSVWPHDGCNLFVSGHIHWLSSSRIFPMICAVTLEPFLMCRHSVWLITVQNHCWLLQNLLQIIIFLAKKICSKMFFAIPTTDNDKRKREHEGMCRQDACLSRVEDHKISSKSSSCDKCCVVFSISCSCFPRWIHSVAH